MRLVVLSLLLLTITTNGFSEEVEENELPGEEEESADEIDTRKDVENEVLIKAPRVKEAEPKNEVGSPEQKNVPEKKRKAQRLSEKMKKVTGTIASKVKEGAKKTASATKKSVKAIGKGVKEGAKKTAFATIKGMKAIGKGVKGGAKKTASLTKKGVKAIAKGVKRGAEALKNKFKNKRKY